jgi:hypothetical protein
MRRNRHAVALLSFDYPAVREPACLTIRVLLARIGIRPNVAVWSNPELGEQIQTRATDRGATPSHSIQGLARCWATSSTSRSIVHAWALRAADLEAALCSSQRSSWTRPPAKLDLCGAAGDSDPGASPGLTASRIPINLEVQQGHEEGVGQVPLAALAGNSSQGSTQE